MPPRYTNRTKTSQYLDARRENENRRARGAYRGAPAQSGQTDAERRKWLAYQQWLEKQQQSLPAGIGNPNKPPANSSVMQGQDDTRTWIDQNLWEGEVSLNKADYKPTRGWNTRQKRTLAKFPSNISEMYYIGSDQGDAYIPQNNAYAPAAAEEPAAPRGGRRGRGGGGYSAPEAPNRPYGQQLAGWLTKMAQWNT